MKNAIYIIIGIALIAGVFVLGRWSKRDRIAEQIDAITQTGESLTDRSEYFAEYIRSAERQNLELENIITELRAENRRAYEILREIESDNTTIISGSESLESGLGDLAGSIAGLIADIEAGED